MWDKNIFDSNVIKIVFISWNILNLDCLKKKLKKENIYLEGMKIYILKNEKYWFVLFRFLIV